MFFPERQEIYVFGNNMFGQLGIGWSKIENDRDLNVPARLFYTAIPQPLHVAHKIQEVYCGLDHTFFLTDKGHIFSMGWNIDGQLGLGDTQDRKIKKLSVSTDVTLAIDGKSSLKETKRRRRKNHLSMDLEEGNLMAWGNSEYGQCMVFPNVDKVWVCMDLSTHMLLHNNCLF
jgi:alpha-tubulin suppressor-like RCC1 family protein